VVTYPTGAMVATGLISFGLGVAVGSIFNNGWGWGWGCNWGRHPSLYVNNNFFNANRNAFVNHRNWNGSYFGNGRANWAHNPRFREGVPYNNRNVANRFNGGRAGNMRPAQLPANVGNIKPPGGLGSANRFAGVGGNGPGRAGQLPANPGMNRPSQLPANRPSAGQFPNMGANRMSGARPSSIGSANRMNSGGFGGGSRNFGGGSRNFGGGGARHFGGGGHRMGGGGFRGGGRRR